MHKILVTASKYTVRQNKLHHFIFAINCVDLSILE